MIYDKREIVNLQKGSLPVDYHCDCEYCQKFIGKLIRQDGTFYSKLDRNKYYVDKKRHFAKTPLHVARWCIQNFSNENDWVLDPTMGAGTTAVEALNHDRNVVGVEIEFTEVIRDNIYHNKNMTGKECIIFPGDARDIKTFCQQANKRFSLIINNPPYSGGECEKSMSVSNPNDKSNRYDRSKNNLAFLKEGEEYYRLMKQKYSDCSDFLLPGGRLCIGVKDMIRNKKPYLLHKHLGDAIKEIHSLKYEGMALLPHFPPTLFMSTYGKKYPELNKIIPRYQTILVFKKREKISPTTICS